MNRHLLVGRYGPDDQISIPGASDEQLTDLQLVSGEKSLDHGIGGALTSLKAPRRSGWTCWCLPRTCMLLTRASPGLNSHKILGRAKSVLSCP